MTRRRIEINEDALREAWMDETLTTEDLEYMFECSLPTLKARAVELGLQRRKNGAKKKRPEPDPVLQGLGEWKPNKRGVMEWVPAQRPQATGS